MSDAKPEKNIEDADVVTKYKAAAEIAAAALEAVTTALRAGRSVAELCRLGDQTVSKRCAAVFNKARDERGERVGKGVAFPTCISVNHCGGHFSPLPNEDQLLAAGDLCTIDLGAHIDGYVAVLCTSAVVPAETTEAVGGDAAAPPPPAPRLSDKAARAVMAAYTAAEAALRLLRPGCTNSQITEMFAQVAADFGVSVVEGVLSHEMKRYVIDGRRAVLSKSTADQRVDEFTFEPHTVFAVDVVMSTSEGGKLKPGNGRTTVYKRAVEVDYMLKMKASRQLLNEVNRTAPVFPFTLRNAVPDDAENRVVRLGISEMQSHGMVIPYPVLYDREGEYVARFKCTALILPAYTEPITPLRLPAGVETDAVLQNEAVKALLRQPVGKSAKRLSKQAGRQPGNAAATDSNGTPVQEGDGK